MAEEQAKPEAPKSKGSMKTILTVALLLVVEAGVIIAAMALLGRNPDVANASDPMLDPAMAESEKIVEVLVLDAKLPNAKSGVAYLYSTEIYAQVRQKHAAIVEENVQQFYNEIKADIGAVWRTSDPHHFQEPKLENLTRKISAMLGDRFGVDPDGGEKVLVKCIIVMGTGFRVDR